MGRPRLPTPDEKLNRVLVGETRGVKELLESIDEDRRLEIIREERRSQMAKKVAEYRWAIAEKIHRLADGKSKLDFESRPFQPQILQDEATDIVIYGSAQYGKAIDNEEPVLTPDGWVRNGDILPGSKVITPTGEAVDVLHVFPQGVIPIYCVTLENGRKLRACAEHLWERADHGIVNTERLDFDLHAGEGISIPWFGADREVRFSDVKSIDFIGNRRATCIYIDHPSHLYVAGDGVISHNTEILICNAVAASGVCGLKVLWVISKVDKKNKFVGDRLDPCFTTVPMYKKLVEQAQKRGAKTDNKGLKHFGDGLINLVHATSESEFTTYSADYCQIDEHQECDQNNLRKVDDRMSGSDFGLMMRVGHPSIEGTEENQNLDYLYQNSNRNIWHVPCHTCGLEQELTWEGHCVVIARNKSGGILSVKPRDEEWTRESGLDMRPVCQECHRPMIRLTKKGFWKEMNPGVRRHGYQLSNLYNPSPTCKIERLFERFVAARHSPNDMQEFFNKVLGKCYSMGSEKITESMLSQCSTGDSSGVPPFRFVPVSAFDWRQMEKEAEVASST